jgi:hypothetical protein
MSNVRVWIFRVLVLVAAGLFLVSWFNPWWSATLEALNIKDAVIIHPYGLDMHNVQDYMEYFEGAEDAMPGFFTPFMWAYLGLAILALLVGAFVNNKNIKLFGKELNLSRWLVGIVGFSIIVVAAACYLVASAKSAQFGLPALVGRFFIGAGSYAEQSWVTAKLLPGYWIACGVGPFLLLLALFKNKIIGNTK